uniref:Phospholysine phosphohistidine inorganic pyrophosphate phosphatase n=1 Tax=Triatoma infestans TaxID=30076 RepID=A0A023F9B8_TRIIF
MAFNHAKLLKQPIKALLLDISGVLKDGDIPVQGSLEAVRTLQSMGFPFRLITNETLKPKSTIRNTLQMLGYEVNEQDMQCPVPFLKEILIKENLRPHLLLHPRMFAEFEGIDLSNPNCVVMGDAEEYFHYDSLNECFRKLIAMKNPILFSLGINKYYLDDDGLSMDVGAYCKGIEYATGVKARIVGKPSKEYFLRAVNKLGFKPEEVVMIGDDIEYDVGGAQECGLRGVLVKTGKFRPSDELHPKIKPDAIVENLQQFVEMYIKAQDTKQLQGVSA